MLVTGHMIVTMSSKRVMPAATFKAECLAVLDRVAETGESVVVTKRGRPVAEVVPVKRKSATPLIGSVKVHGDLTRPILSDWDLDA
jgi:prevent-host-death family protein